MAFYSTDSSFIMLLIVAKNEKSFRFHDTHTLSAETSSNFCLQRQVQSASHLFKVNEGEGRVLRRKSSKLKDRGSLSPWESWESRILRPPSLFTIKFLSPSSLTNVSRVPLFSYPFDRRPVSCGSILSSWTISSTVQRQNSIHSTYLTTDRDSVMFLAAGSSSVIHVTKTSSKLYFIHWSSF